MLNSETSNQKQNFDRPLINLLVNIVIPVIILTKFSEYLGPLNSLIFALSFPLTYGGYDLINQKRFNLFSALGFISILLTGGIGLMKLDAGWIAVKEAIVPLIFGAAVLISARQKTPLVQKLFFNEQVFNISKINEVLMEKGASADFEKKMVSVTYLIASSFALSSVLNFILAKVILVSATGTTAFNEELGKMTALSFPVIVVPCFIIFGFSIWYLVRNIKTITGLDSESIFRQ